MKAFILGTLAALTAAMTKGQKQIVRESLKKAAAPQFSVVVDGVTTPGIYAFTDAGRERTYIDFARFANAPIALRNVVDHEAQHLLGRDHNTLVGDPMSYLLTVDRDGNVVEDAAIWAK